MATNIKKYELLANDAHLEKLYAGVDVLDADACWNWTGAKVKDGYGVMERQINNKRHTIFVHRLSWTAQNGEIPDGMVVDHTCHTAELDNCEGVCQHRSCINPAHLRVTTMQENLKVKRANSKAFANLGLMHPEDRGSCINGHPYSEDSYVTYKSGKRACKSCVKINNTNSLARAKAKAGN